MKKHCWRGRRGVLHFVLHSRPGFGRNWPVLAGVEIERSGSFSLCGGVGRHWPANTFSTSEACASNEGEAEFPV
jgi:hypothetical protein